MNILKKLALGAFLLIGLCLFTATTPVYAEQAPIPDNEVSDQSGVYNLDSYGSQMVSDEGWSSFFTIDTGQWINSGANIFFEINKISYSVFRKGISIFGKSSVLQDNISTFTSYSKSLFDTLYGKFGLTIIVCMSVYVFYLYYVKSPQRAMKQLVAFMAVIIFALGWNAQGTKFVKWFNSISNEIQLSLLQATTNSQGSSMSDATVTVQNTLFELAVKEPYYLMNYGKTSKINTPDNPKKTNEFLYSGKTTKEQLNKVQSLVNEAGETNEFLQPSKAGWKLAVGFLSPIMTISIGIPLLAIQFMNFMVELIALVVSGFVGLSAFLSLIPKFQQALWKMMQFLLGAFGIRVLLGLAFLMLVSVVNVIRTAIPSEGIANYVLQVMAICIVIIMIWKYRDKIIYMITGGVVASLDKGIINKTTQPVKNVAKNSTKYAGDIAGLMTVGVPLGDVAGNTRSSFSDYTKENAKDIYEDRIARKQERQSDDFILDSDNGKFSRRSYKQDSNYHEDIQSVNNADSRGIEEPKEATGMHFESAPIIVYPNSDSLTKLGDVSKKLSNIESNTENNIPGVANSDPNEFDLNDFQESESYEKVVSNQNNQFENTPRFKYQLDSPNDLGNFKEPERFSNPESREQILATSDSDLKYRPIDQLEEKINIEDMVLTSNYDQHNIVDDSEISFDPELTTLSQESYSLYSTTDNNNLVSVTNEVSSTQVTNDIFQNTLNPSHENFDTFREKTEKSIDSFEYSSDRGAI